MKNNVIVSHADALEILFSNRNRAYGAYQLRRQYPSTLAKALGIGLIFIGLLVAMPQIMKAFSGFMPEKTLRDENYVIREIVLPPLPPKPPTPSTPPPARSTQRFVPPVVDKDEVVPDEPPKLTNDDLLKNTADVGKTTVDVPVQAPPTLKDPGLGNIIESPKSGSQDDPLELFDLQKAPLFPGGINALMAYLAKKIEYPKMAKETGIQGTVVLSFVVGKDGSINDVAVLKDIGGGCGKEAIRVVKAMPHWSPGEANGHPVKVRYTLPVKFKLN